MEKNDQISDQIFDYHERTQQSSFRHHMGASVIGDECHRKIWYQFRWAKDVRYNGRTLRLFELGKQAEKRLMDDLTAIGIKVQLPTDGRTASGVPFAGHIKGTCDGYGSSEEHEDYLVEFKTHNDASFKSLLRGNLKETKPQHYKQVQMYMGLYNSPKCIYLAENKNTSNLHSEIIDFDRAEYDRMLAKASYIISMDFEPTRIGDENFYLCKMCDFKDICHQGAEIEITCRTCKNVRPQDDGTWKCALNDKILGIKDQKDACDNYEVTK